MTPDPLPSAGDRRAWNRLARLAETADRPEGWKVHRPGAGVYALGLVVFGLTGGACLMVTAVEGPILCPLAGAVLFLSLAAFCLSSLVLQPRHYLLLAPEWLFVSRPLAPSLLLAWTDVRGIELRMSKNPRQTKDTHGTIAIRRDAGEVRIDGFEPDHLRFVHEELTAYWRASIP